MDKYIKKKTQKYPNMFQTTNQPMFFSMFGEWTAGIW